MGRIAMSLRDDAHMELMSLLEALRDRTLTLEQQVRISEILTQYPEYQEYYVDYIFLIVALENYQFKK